jgi:2-keto-4-pentenoate hydratase/2-oxohepta-3-ene-1,7-dioic acid hydratase in catechol pathway
MKYLRFATREGSKFGLIE